MRIDLTAAVEEHKRKADKGNTMSIYKWIEIGCVGGRYGAWLEEHEELRDRLLGLPKANKEQVVKIALEQMQCHRGTDNRFRLWQSDQISCSWSEFLRLWAY